MKKLLFGVMALILLASCSGNGGTDKSREDSILRADSIRQADSIAAAEVALKAQQAMQDSIRQDSVRNDEAFANALKALEHLPSSGNLDKYLKGLGFTGSSKSSVRSEYDDAEGFDREVDVQKFNYTLTLGNKSIKYQRDIQSTMSWDTDEEKVTIEGDEDALNNFYNNARKRGDEVTKKGNTVTIFSAGA